jgi:hypothetical protein
MAQVESEFVTRADYLSEWRKQAVGITNEFTIQRSLIETVRNDVVQLTEEVGEIKARLHRIDAQRHNLSRRLPHHSLASVGAYRPDTGFHTPLHFPRSIKEFWNLQFQAQSMSSRDIYYIDNLLIPYIERDLVYLIRFYDIQGYEYWGRDEDYSSESDTDNRSSDRSNSSQQHVSLEEAVRKYPLDALNELASCFGLVFSDIHDFYQRAAQYRQRPQRGGTKRGTDMVGMSEDRKRTRVSKPQSLSDIPDLPIRSPIAQSESSGGQLLWDVQSNERRKADLMAKMQGGGIPSRGSPKDSSTEVLPSQEMRQVLQDRKKGSDR